MKVIREKNLMNKRYSSKLFLINWNENFFLLGIALFENL
jgi:hypothetical protein